MEGFLTSLKDECKKLCLGPDGVDLFGVASVARFGDQPEKHRPEAFLPGARSVVVLGSQRFKVLTDRLKATREVGEFSFRDILEAHSETVGTDLRQTGYRLARYLTNRGFASINLDQKLTDGRTLTGAFSFKGAAAAAGLGVIGKNSLLLTPAYGPRVVLAAVITSPETPAATATSVSASAPRGPSRNPVPGSGLATTGSSASTTTRPARAAGCASPAARGRLDAGQPCAGREPRSRYRGGQSWGSFEGESEAGLRA